MVRSRLQAAPAGPAERTAPIATVSTPAPPAPSGPTQSGQDVYTAIVQNMARSERERSPPRGDRRPLSVQRNELAGLSGDASERAVALAKRDKTLPKPPVTVAASSSNGKPPPPPGAGAIKKKKVEIYNIAKKPRPQTLTRPLVPQDPISGKKRPAEDDGGIRTRPPQPPPPPPPSKPRAKAIARSRPAPAAPAAPLPKGTKRPGPPLSRPGRPVQPAGPPIQIQAKGKTMESPPMRPNQKKKSERWRQPRVNSKWSKVNAR